MIYYNLNLHLYIYFNIYVKLKNLSYKKTGVGCWVSIKSPTIIIIIT